VREFRRTATVRLTDDERERLEALAHTMGAATPSQAIRMLIRNARLEVKLYKVSELDQAVRDSESGALVEVRA